MIIKAKLLYDGEGLRKNVFVEIERNKITKVSSETPKEGQELIETEVLTPAFIDVHSHIGMDRAGDPYTEGEANEEMESIITLANALDSVYMDDPAFTESIETGVLYSCVLPGSGNILSGKAAVIKNFEKILKMRS